MHRAFNFNKYCLSYSRADIDTMLIDVEKLSHEYYSYMNEKRPNLSDCTSKERPPTATTFISIIDAKTVGESYDICGSKLTKRSKTYNIYIYDRTRELETLRAAH